MKIAVGEALGSLLDYLVSGCEGTPLMRYSADWSLGGPIIEREGIFVMKVTKTQWRADCGPACCGKTPLIAAMRAYAVKKLGMEVDVPDRFLPIDLKSV